MWEDLKVADAIAVLSAFIDSNNSEKKEEANKLLKTLMGDIATVADDTFSRLKGIEGKISTEANIKSLASYLKDIFEGVTRSYPKTKKAKDEVMAAYNEFSKIDPAVFINTVNAEMPTIQNNLYKLFEVEFPRYRDFLSNCGDQTQDQSLIDFIDVVTSSLGEIDEKDGVRNDATDLNNDIDNCTEDNYD